MTEHAPTLHEHTAVHQAVVISDLHVGCRMALCPPSGVPLGDGNHYYPGATQAAIWRAWREFWDEWVPRVTRGEPYVVVINGDLLDGVHHGSVSQFTHDIAEQRDLAEQILEPELAHASAVYVTDGTEAHSGKSSQDDRDIARRIGAVPNEAGRHSRGDLWLWLGGEGRCLVHFAHHIGTTSSLSYESTAVTKEIDSFLSESARWGERTPDVVVRSHRHRKIQVTLDGWNGEIIGVVTPAWQGKTPFVYRIPGGRIALPQIGGILVRAGDEEHYVRSFSRTLPRSKAEVA